MLVATSELLQTPAKQTDKRRGKSEALDEEGVLHKFDGVERAFHFRQFVTPTQFPPSAPIIIAAIRCHSLATTTKSSCPSNVRTFVRMGEANYCHGTLYRFNPQARAEVINRFDKQLNEVSARCSYNAQHHVRWCGAYALDELTKATDL